MTSFGLQERFSHIYATSAWGTEGNGSGVGSSLAATVLLVSIVRAVVLAYNIQALLDAPCGAMAWQPRLLEALQEDNPTFQYLGVDIVPQVIQVRCCNRSCRMRLSVCALLVLGS